MKNIDYVQMFLNYKYDKGLTSYKKRCLDSIEKIIKENKNYPIDSLVEYVFKQKNYKRTLQKYVVGYIDYINDKCKTKIPNDLKQYVFFENSLERQLEIAKFLHQEHSIQEIVEQFNIDERTVRTDLHSLEEGIDVFGQIIKLDGQLNSGRIKKYQCSMNPIFLPLTLTECYALTAYLRKLSENDINKELYEFITNKIYSQLTQYAKNMIGSDYKFDNYDFKYQSEDIFVKKEFARIMYLFKSGAQCDISYYDEENKLINISGRIQPNFEDEKKINIIVNDEIITLNLKQIMIKEVNIKNYS